MRRTLLSLLILAFVLIYTTPCWAPTGGGISGSGTTGQATKWVNPGTIGSATNTDAEVADAVTKKHAANSDSDFAQIRAEMATDTELTDGLAEKVDSDSATYVDVVEKAHSQNTDTSAAADYEVVGLLTVDSGIQFPATQASSTNVNTLDDYEEGTFECTLTCGTSGTITLAAGTEGKYTKIGNVVHFSIVIDVESVSSPVGRLSVSTLPFTCSGPPVCGYVWAGNLNAGYGEVLQWDLEVGNTFIYLDRYSDGAHLLDVAAAIKALSRIRFSGIYFTAN